MFTEDLTAFYSESDFADIGTVSGNHVPGIFDSAYQLQAGVVSGTFTAFEIMSSDAFAIVGASITIRSVTYRIVDRQKIEDGARSVLILETP